MTGFLPRWDTGFKNFRGNDNGGVGMTICGERNGTLKLPRRPSGEGLLAMGIILEKSCWLSVD